ncbi:hypothetical protein FOTG_17239 [Fusarium oxysporum f. sp. vasinfectum 25433]|uniref:Uncharacterized protein n=1 Tax=Fusarium oxysporum f. sp. vasinfectum 25433 TaxID=1089449 RepID=X0M112_FUSOX|nr:hypothetical protein FOTG_17239 [Fusarium oxysporum f. sp. vasinfectum 25433]
MERSYKVPVRPRIGLAVNQSVLWVPRKTPVAAIAGGTVGGVVGVAILSGFGWWFCRRRRAARKTLGKNAADKKSLKRNQMMHSSLAEANARLDSVLVESDVRLTKPRTFHELAA